MNYIKTWLLTTIIILIIRVYLNKFSISTKFKSIWIQIIDKEGVSVYRSWIDKKGIVYFFRKDLRNFMENRKFQPQLV